MAQHTIIVIDQDPAQFEQCMSKILQYPHEKSGVKIKERVRPGLFTIGPFYAKDGMDEGKLLKWALAKAFLKRSNIDMVTYQTKYEEWLAGISTTDEKEARYYNNGEEYIVDSLFVIEVIWRFTCGGPQEAADGLISTSLNTQARLDMIVFRNQLPFSILEDLYNMTFPSRENTDLSFMNLCINFFSECMLIKEYSKALEIVGSQGTQAKDFLDLMRKCHTPFSKRQPPPDLAKFTPMHKATYLLEAGMAISAGPSTRSLCSLQYSEGVLEIPKLKINDFSLYLLENLIIADLERHQEDTFFVDYIYFMGSLIGTSQDVDVLIHKGILENFLRDSNEVVTRFHEIVADTPLNPHNYYYHGICEAMNHYCKDNRNKYRAILKRDYCSSPWMIASTTAASILLILTLIQTVCSIKSVV